MNANVCPQCGGPITPGAPECRFCGEKLAQQQFNQQSQQQYNRQPYNQQYNQQQYNQQQYNQPYNRQQYNQPQYGQPYNRQPYNQPQYNQPYNQQQYNQPQYNQLYNRQPQPVYNQQPLYTTGISPTWPIKNKTVAGLLAIFFGSFGIHKFYLGKVGAGILYLLFCWTYIPSIVGFVEGIIYLCSNDENFQLKHHVRLE